MLRLTLGPEDANVAVALNNLAQLYSARGQDKKSEPLYKRALAIREKVLGQDDPNVATTLNDLAKLYANQGHRA
jgi:tetratricopeptide (TPR) repeat protein